jgi:hypothetical protein
MPSANQKALDILCGMPAAQCTPQKWYFIPQYVHHGEKYNESDIKNTHNKAPRIVS